jgi:DNA repair exonuclease SbcCD nuclease subunit
MSNKNNSSYEILKNTGSEIEKIFHISDIHIGNDRHDEFRLVFSRLFNIIREKVGNSNNKCLIVITGDIIDSWNLSPQAIELLNEFYTDATSITSCISISGNHEYKGLDTKYSNPLYPLIDQNFNTGNSNKSYTIGENKCYLYENIIFGLTTPFSDKVTPCKIKKKGVIKIGLYHGTVYNAQDYQKFIFKDDSYFGCEDFNDYKYVLLGDIHKEQSMNADKTIRYPGSLIQLKKSESPDHGFILWDLKKEKSTFITVPNDNVQLCIDETDNINKLNLQQYNGKNIQITLRHRSGTDKSKIKHIQDTINKKLNKSDISYETNIDYSDTQVNVDLDINGKKESLLKILNKNDAITFIVDYMKRYYDATMMDKIKKMLKLLATRIKYDDNITINNIKIEKLEFDNMFIFGNDNHIDFTKFNGLVGLNSRNGTGKSSIIDTICLSIYGSQSRGTEDMKSALKKGAKEFKTDITLSVNKDKYRIVRIYKRAGNDYMKFGSCSVTIYKNKKEIKSYDKSTGWLAANKFIADTICSYDDFVNHFVILQKVDTGFSNMGKKRGDYLLDIFKLDLFNEFSNEISAEKRHISTRFASVANMLVDLNLIKKGDSHKIKDKQKLMNY